MLSAMHLRFENIGRVECDIDHLNLIGIYFDIQLLNSSLLFEH